MRDLTATGQPTPVENGASTPSGALRRSARNRYGSLCLFFLTYTVHRHSSAPHTVTATTARPHGHGLTGSRPPGNSSLFFFLFLLSSDLLSSFFFFFLLLLSSSVDWFDSGSAFLSLSIFCSLQLLIQLPICLFLSLYLFYCFSSQYTVHSTLQSAHINHKWAICLSLFLYLFYCFSTQHISITYSLDLFNYFSLLVNT